MPAPTVCPTCKGWLGDTAKPHCQDKRTKPCLWVRCSCGEVLDRHGRHYNGTPNPEAGR